MKKILKGKKESVEINRDKCEVLKFEKNSAETVISI